jgi:hypothetical protein
MAGVNSRILDGPVEKDFDTQSFLESTRPGSYLVAVRLSPMDTNLRTRRASLKRASWAAIGLGGISLLATSCSSSSAVPSSTSAPATAVLSPTYAKSAGFPKTINAAKKSAVTSQKGCSSTVGAVYADSAKQTALISSVLNCDSPTSASAALADIKKQYGADSAIAIPKGLGISAFATASIAPQYLLAWQTGSKVAITAIDVDLAASGTTSSTVASAPLTSAQEKTLGQAAEAQDALMK